MRTAARPDFRKRRETDFWRAVNRAMVILIGLGSVGLIVMAFYPELRRIDEMQQNWDALKQELAAEELRYRQQERADGWLKSDPEYVETLARDRLGLMKEGETIFRLDSRHGLGEPPAGQLQ